MMCLRILVEYLPKMSMARRMTIDEACQWHWIPAFKPWICDNAVCTDMMGYLDYDT